jgi:hypothetical protein
MDTLKEMLALFGFGPDNIQAVLYISLASVFVPQLVKRTIPTIRPELLAAVSGAVAGYMLWSSPAKGALVGIILGSFWTAMYKPLMRLAYKRWPELEERVSAKPVLKRMADGSVGIKEDEDAKTRILTAEERELFVGSTTEVPAVPKEGATVPKPEPGNE